MRFNFRFLMAVAVLVGWDAPAGPTRAQEAEIVLPGDQAVEPATVDGCQVIARIDNQVVLACEVLYRVNMKLEDNRDKIPPEQYEAVRDQLAERGLEISPVRHFEDGEWIDGKGGPWNSFAFFDDPDGNGWVLQERPAEESTGS